MLLTTLVVLLIFLTEKGHSRSGRLTSSLHKTPPFMTSYIKDCIKNVILNVYALFISFHNVCGKVLLICGKV